jgi:1-acyl-sn-glycerol-3-phosphate acyltransferase
MRLLRRLARILRVFAHVARGLWQAKRYLPRTPPPRTAAQWAIMRQWHRRALQLVGVEVRIHGQPVDGPVLFVANHISWLDIGLMATIVDAGFIGKSELADWPVLGVLIRQGGTIFVDRDGRDGGTAAAEEMAQRLQRGERVAVFPEGTTSDGGDVRRFHPRLFAAARSAGVPIQPVALRYDNARAPFTGGVGFMGHLWGILGEPRIHADIDLLDPIDPDGLDRRRLAARARAAIRARLTGADDRARTGRITLTPGRA